MARDDLERLAAGGNPLRNRFEELARLRLKAEMGQRESATAHRANLEQLGEEIAVTRLVADVTGRLRVARQVSAELGGEKPGRAPVVLELERLPFAEALEELAARQPVVARDREAMRHAYAVERQFALVRSADIEITRQVQAFLDRAESGGKSFDSFRAGFEALKQDGFTASYAEVVFRTNLATAYSAGRFREAMKSPEVAPGKPFVVGLEYRAVLDARTRPNHAAAHGHYAPLDDPIWLSRSPPYGFHCFSGETLVEGSIRKIFRALYAGEMVEITLESGRQLALTPNHQVLTTHGFVEARSLYPGTYCLSYRGEPDRPTIHAPYDIDENHEPTSVEEVFRAAREGREIFPVGVVPGDFDGDAISFESDVDVIALDGELRDGTETIEQDDETFLVAAGSPAVMTTLLERAGRGYQRRDIDLAAAGRHPGGATLAGQERGIVRRSSAETPLRRLRLGASAAWDARLIEPARDDVSGHASLLRQLLLAHAGDVALDKVVRVRRFFFRGHVYDLQTDTGLIVANGTIISNCRCTVQPITRVEAKRRGILVADTIARSAWPGTAIPDDPARFGQRPDRAIYGAT